MRARLALRYSGLTVELREVVLKDKPAELTKISPKSTVPVLHVSAPESCSKVIDESLEIMIWALERNDPIGWLPTDQSERIEQLNLIKQNDEDFKSWLDRYKYSDRYPEHSAEYYRSQCELFLRVVEDKLSINEFLFGPDPTLSDMAIFPFIRQFAFVDKSWFDQCQYPQTQSWLASLLNSELFNQIMTKYIKWEPGSEPVLF